MSPLRCLIYLTVCTSSSAWIQSPGMTFKTRSQRTKIHAVVDHDDTITCTSTRRNLLANLFFVSTAVICSPAQALVKGNAPPPKTKAMSDKPKCTNVEECQALAEQKQREEMEEMAQGPPPKTTAKGTRYLDLETGSGPTVKDGNEVEVYYKVLKLGKRSYDGLSGEGTVVFSRGYGLEDDEKEPKTKTFTTTVGSFQNIGALNDAIMGMNKGGIRRFSIVPQQGWERATKQCDGGPGGRGAGGDLKTDYVVVPTATMVATETCFDQTKLPFPVTYAQQRRMAQRFDQSLIMEVQVVDVRSGV